MLEPVGCEIRADYNGQAAHNAGVDNIIELRNGELG